MAMREIVIEAPGRNALGDALMRSLTTQLGDAGGAPVLLTGAGDVFCAGLNLKEVAALDAAGMAAFLEVLDTLVQTLYEYPGPTAAAVNGHAIAGGCVLVLACDLSVMTAAPNARIGLNEVGLGLRFPPRVWKMLTRRLSGPALERTVLGAALHAPGDALALGLVDEIAGDPVARARELLEQRARHPAAAYAAAKRGLRPNLALDAAERERFAREALPAWTGPELKARIATLLAR